MSEDEFGWSSGDEEPFAAATDTAPDGKRKLTINTVDTASEAKRNRHTSCTTVTSSPSTILANRILKERFAIDSFRLEQERAITRILDGGSAVVVFPTGGGKSLCYQASYIFVQLLNQSDFLRCLPWRSDTKTNSLVTGLLNKAA
jgi:hypothetical protein